MRFLIVLTCFLTTLAHNCHAQLGSIAVNPTRIHFDDQNRRQEVEFINLSDDTVTFTITFSHYRMMESGSLILLDQPDTNLLIADDYIRIFPRKVTLFPREKQKVNLQFRKRSGMAPGEYRSHLTFSQFIDETKLREEYQTEDSTTLQTILLQKFKICVPAIIRMGDVEASSSIENIALNQQDSLQFISFDVNRLGNSSLYGDLEVEYQPAKGKPYLIGKQRFVGVYPEVGKRKMNIRLKNMTPEDLTAGSLNIRYVNADENDPMTYCETAFKL